MQTPRSSDRGVCLHLGLFRSLDKIGPMLSTSTKTLRQMLPIWLACLGVSGVCSSGLARADDGSRDNIHGDMILMQGKWNLVDFVYYRDNLAQRIPKAQRRGTRIVNGNRLSIETDDWHAAGG